MFHLKHLFFQDLISYLCGNTKLVLQQMESKKPLINLHISKSFVEILEKVLEKAYEFIKQQDPFNNFVSDVVNYLKTRPLDDVTKKGLSIILGELFQIEYILDTFSEPKNILQTKQFEEAIRSLQSTTKFERIMYNLQFQIGESSYTENHLLLHVNQNPFLIYQVSFCETYAFDYFEPSEIINLLKSEKIFLKNPLQGESNITLLEALLTRYKSFDTSHANDLKEIIVEEGIQGNQEASKGRTYDQLFSEKFKGDTITKKLKIRIVQKSLFQTYQVNSKSSLQNLSMKPFQEKQLKSRILSPFYFSQSFSINGNNKNIDCTKEHIHTDEQKNQIRCCFNPPLGKMVEWKILQDPSSEMIILDEQTSKEINQILSNDDKKGNRIILVKAGNENHQFQIDTKDLTVSKIEIPEIIFGYLVWIPSYKKQQEASLTEQDNNEGLIEEQVITEKIADLIQDRDQRIFYGLAYLQRYFPSQISANAYNVNEMNIICRNSGVQKMLEQFENQQLKKCLSEYLGGQNQIKLTFSDLESSTSLVRYINKYGKLNLNKLVFQAQYNQTNNAISIKGFKALDRNTEDFKNREMFIDLFCKYLFEKEKNKDKKMQFKLNAGQKQMVQALKAVASFDSVNIPGGKTKITGSPAVLQTIINIISNDKVKVKLDMSKELLYLENNQRCYMKDIASKVKINKLRDPTFEIQCENKYLTEFMNKLYASKLQLQKDSRKEFVSRKEFFNQKHYNKYIKLQTIRDVEIKIIGTDKQKMMTIQIVYPKDISKFIEDQIMTIKKQIDKENIIIRNLDNVSFTIENISPEIAMKINQVLNQSQEQLKKQSQKSNLLNTFEKIVQVNVKTEKINSHTQKFTLVNASPASKKRFEQDTETVKQFVDAYKTEMLQLSNQKVDKCVNQLLSNYKVSKQKTTEQRKANNIFRDLLCEEIKKVIWPLRDKKIQQLNRQAIQYLENGFGLWFKPSAFQDFKKQYKSECRIEIFKIFLERQVLLHMKNSRIQQTKVKKYQTQIKSNLNHFVVNLQKMYEGGQVIPIDNIVSFERSIRIFCDTFFKIDLPIVQHLNTFRQKLSKSRVMVVKTGTGSGKSTILPPYMIGLGYKKVFVTQPRRLPCKRICQRISTTNGNDIVGYRLGGGVSKNPDNDLIYITDGLLKELLYGNDTFLKDVGVIMLDEVHEETKSVDLIILLLRKLMHKYPELKVILCSATVNESLIKLFDSSLPVEVFQVEVSRHPVKQQPIRNTSILEKVKQLYKQLSKNDQMLVFFPSVNQVELYRKVFLEEYGIKAHALFGEQRPQIQEEAMTQGRVIFSTSIAETSLTFTGLTIVVDSQKSRIKTYDTKQKMVVSKQIKSSASSIKQRKGRLGRTQPGTYYYMVYNDQSESSPYDLSELDRSELLNVCFELLMKYKDWREVQKELLTLKVHDPVDFKQKLQQAQKTFCSFGDLIFRHGSYKVSQTCEDQIFCYGNMGNVYYNIALYESISHKCFQNMVAVVSFVMTGLPVYQTILNNYQGNRLTCTGDMEVAGQFLLNISRKMRLQNVKISQVYSTFIKLPEAKQFSNMGTLLPRVIMQMKKLFLPKLRSVIGTNDWTIVNKILTKIFTNNLFFNRGIIGGNNRYFEKIVPEMVYHPNMPIEVLNQIQYQLNQNSVLYSKADKVPFIVALGSVINPFSACTLSLCCKAYVDVIKTKINLELEQHTSPLGKLQIVKETEIYNPRIGPKNSMIVHRNGNKINLIGSFSDVFNEYSQLNKLLVKNWAIDLEELLNDKIADRMQLPHKRSIRPEDIKANFQKINCFDLFTPLTREFKTVYNIDIRWKNKGKVEINKASNFVISILMKKINGFLSWFVQTQIILTDNLHQHPVQPNLTKVVDKEEIPQLFKRINQIVDPKIQLPILKSWVSGIYSKVPIRVYRMIAVCWVLVNKYDCSVKGGFVRDWVVNGQHKIPGGPLNHLLQSDGNGFYRIIDEMIVPSDIDVDLSKQIPFNYEQFKKFMNKLGITVEMRDDGWRYLLAFDLNQVTGGFTVDLIHPYCYISHDKCDFDVNMMYIKSGHLNQIGLKIPLKLRPSDNGADTKQFEVKIQQLIQRCRARKMRKIITLLDNFREQKFIDRGWSIDPVSYEPVIHRLLKSTFHPLSKEQLYKRDKNWIEKMIDQQGCTFLSAELIKNDCFETGYDSAKTWVARETKNLNEMILYHGASEEGAKGIAASGFDSRYYGKTFGQSFGRGAYFADNPICSDGYVTPNNNEECFMFICKVVLGNMEIMTAVDKQKMGPQQGYHSIKATCREHMQYVSDRWGQARPFILVKYSKR